mmetsp:Transcript_1925/g.4261  ORF Transcript_1925/g.4261 Transcript_1925/m.4261 type:complete len:530 (+) Transcript_1925:724-2313(+)
MELRPPRNLFVRDRSYSQKPWLDFDMAGVEKRFLFDYSKLQQHLRDSFLTLAALTSLLLFSKGSDGALHIVLFFSVLLAAGIVLRSHYKLLASAFVALIPTLWSSVATLEETLTVLLPAYIYYGVLVKDWKACLRCLTLTSLTLEYIHSTPFIYVSASVSLYTLLSCLGEGDIRSLWVSFDAYKRSCLSYYHLYSQSSYAILITDSDTRVVHANNKGQRLLKDMGADNKLEIIFKDIAFNCGVTSIAAMSEACYKGQSVETEINLIKTVRGRNEVFGVYLLKAKQLSWINLSCIKFTLVNISSVDLQRQLLIKQSKEMLSTLKVAVRELETAYSCQEQLRRSDLNRIHGLYFNLFYVSNLQMLMAGAVELQMIHFSLQLEIVEKIETIAYKVLSKDLEISFNYAPNLPRIVVGDADKISNTVKCIVEFASKLSKVKGLINVIVDSKLDSTNSVEIQLTITFSTSKLTLQELNGLFCCQDNHNIDRIVEISEKHGLGIAFVPMMLKVLKGRVVDCYLQDGSYSKAFISIM